MARFFVDQANIDVAGGVAHITDAEDVKHLSRVLRMECGDKVTLLDGRGGVFDCSITSISKHSVDMSIESVESGDGLENESPVEITIFQCISKGERMDYTVQKCTELGVSRLVPVQSSRVIVKFSDEKSKSQKASRWQKIADEASKQSKRLFAMEVGDVVEIGQVASQIDKYDLFLLPYELEEGCGDNTLRGALRSGEGARRIGVIIGPEGGFEEEEVSLLVAGGARCITLGRRILRTETAGVVVSSIIQYELGDLS